MKLHPYFKSLITTCSNYTPAQNCMNIVCDLYKSYPVVYLIYCCAVMKYSNAAALLPARGKSAIMT